MSKHHLSRADELFQGGGHFPPMFSSNGRHGVPVTLLTKIDLGAPVAALATGLLSAATSAEAPNANTITYTTADVGASPMDSASIPSVATIQASDGSSASVITLDVPRNLSLNVTHASSIVATTATVTGYDEWGQKMVELFTVTATGTTKTVAGKKAFKHILSVALTAAGDATANTYNLGWGDVLGLPYKLADKSDLLAVFGDGTQEMATSTVVAAVTTTATNATGDVRGTVEPATATNGTKTFYVWMHVADKNTIAGMKGVDQYGG